MSLLSKWVQSPLQSLHRLGKEEALTVDASSTLDEPALIGHSDWTVPGASPFPRRGFTASPCQEQNLIIILGGLKEADSADGRASSELCRGDQWSTVLALGGLGAFTQRGVAGSVPTERMFHACALVGCRLVMFGGVGPRKSYDDVVYVLNLGTKTWSRPRISAGSLPTRRHGHTLTGRDDVFWMTGGMNVTDGYLSMDMFELRFDSSGSLKWSRLKIVSDTMPDARAFHSTCLYRDHWVVLFGGECGYDCFDDVWMFDSKTHVWSKLVCQSHSGSKPVARYQHGACMVNDRMWILGGKDYRGKPLSDIWVLDLSVRVWTYLGELPYTRSDVQLCVVKDKIYVMGGQSASERNMNVIPVLQTNRFAIPNYPSPPSSPQKLNKLNRPPDDTVLPLESDKITDMIPKDVEPAEILLRQQRQILASFLENSKLASSDSVDLTDPVQASVSIMNDIQKCMIEMETKLAKCTQQVKALRADLSTKDRQILLMEGLIRDSIPPPPPFSPPPPLPVENTILVDINERNVLPDRNATLEEGIVKLPKDMDRVLKQTTGQHKRNLEAQSQSDLDQNISKGVEKNSEASELQRTLDSALKEMDSLKQQISELTQVRESTSSVQSKQIMQLENLVREHKIKEKSMNKEIAELRLCASKSADESQALKNQTQGLLKELKRLEILNSEAIERYKTEAKEKETILARLGEVEFERCRLEQRNVQIVNTSTSLQSRVQELECQLNAMKKEREALEMSKDQVNSQWNAAQRQNSSTLTQIERLPKELDHVRQSNCNLEDQYNTARASLEAAITRQDEAMKKESADLLVTELENLRFRYAELFASHEKTCHELESVRGAASTYALTVSSIPIPPASPSAPPCSSSPSPAFGAPPPPPPLPAGTMQSTVAPPARNNLLAEIQAGKRLKSVEANRISSTGQKSSVPAPKVDPMSAMLAEMAQKKKLQKKASTETPSMKSKLPSGRTKR